MVHSATLLSIDRAERLAAAGPPTTPDPRAPRGKCPRLAAWPGNEAKQRSLMICMYMAGPDGKGVYNYSSLDALEVKVCPLYIYIYILCLHVVGGAYQPVPDSRNLDPFTWQI